MRTTLAVLTAVTCFACASPALATTPSRVSHDPADNLTIFRVGSAPADMTALEAFFPSSPFEAITFTDNGNPLVSSGGCDQSSPVNCPFGPMEIRLGPLADRAQVFTASFLNFATIIGGAGDDRIGAAAIREDVRGGLGDDLIKASTRVGEIQGGGGDDSLYAREGAELTGGDGNDLMLSDAGPGGTMEGGDGYDVLIRGSGLDAGGPMNGGDDDDVLGFEPGSDAIGFTMTGGPGHDSIHGGIGSNDISGGAGNEEIWTFGGDADTINCGGGFDVVYADATDTVASNCERVTLGAGPADPRLEQALLRTQALRATTI
jgi:hypothetical protein